MKTSHTKEFLSTSISTSLRRRKGVQFLFFLFFLTYPIITQKCIHPLLKILNYYRTKQKRKEEISFRRSCSAEKESPWKIYQASLIPLYKQEQRAETSFSKNGGLRFFFREEQPEKIHGKVDTWQASKQTIYLLIVHSCRPFCPSPRLSSAPHHLALLHPPPSRNLLSLYGRHSQCCQPRGSKTLPAHVPRTVSFSATPANLSPTFRERPSLGRSRESNQPRQSA